jgi:hypothetical protein
MRLSVVQPFLAHIYQRNGGPWMEQWSAFRGQAWRIDDQWTATRLFVHAERPA